MHPIKTSQGKHMEFIHNFFTNKNKPGGRRVIRGAMSLDETIKLNISADLTPWSKRLAIMERMLKVSIFGLLLVAEAYLLVWGGVKYGLINKAADKHNSNIVVVDIDKSITSAYVRRIMDKLDKVEENPELYKHVLIEFNSPGGEPVASEELAYYLKDFQKDVNTTFYVSSSATSGAYMIAVTAQKLYAAPSAFVGSIGVLLQSVSLQGAMGKVGVKDMTIASHEKKEPISLMRDTTPENERYIKDALLAPVYNNFFNWVAKNRHMSKEELTPFAEGRVFVASETVGVLVDEIMPLHKVKQMIINERGFDKKKTVFVRMELNPSNNPFKTSFDVNLNLPAIAEGMR